MKNNSKKKSSGRQYAREITMYQAYTHMTAGFFKVSNIYTLSSGIKYVTNMLFVTLQLLVGLKKERKILIPCETFDNECVRYEHRFSAFSNLLTPPLMPYGCVKENGPQIYNPIPECSVLLLVQFKVHRQN